MVVGGFFFCECLCVDCGIFVVVVVDWVEDVIVIFVFIGICGFDFLFCEDEIVCNDFFIMKFLFLVGNVILDV